MQEDCGHEGDPPKKVCAQGHLTRDHREHGQLRDLSWCRRPEGKAEETQELLRPRKSQEGFKKGTGKQGSPLGSLLMPHSFCPHGTWQEPCCLSSGPPELREEENGRGPKDRTGSVRSAEHLCLQSLLWKKGSSVLCSRSHGRPCTQRHIMEGGKS